MWGLIPVAMLTGGAFLTERSGIEDDLTLRTKQAFERQGLSWANAAFEGRDAVLTGKASEDDEPQKAVDANAKVVEWKPKASGGYGFGGWGGHAISRLFGVEAANLAGIVMRDPAIATLGLDGLLSVWHPSEK